MPNDPGKIPRAERPLDVIKDYSDISDKIFDIAFPNA